MKKLILIACLLSLQAYSWPGNGNGNGNGNNGSGHPGNSDPPNDNCAHCQPEAPIEPGAVVLCFSVAAVFYYSRKYRKP